MINVLVYIVDALRADHLGCHGYGRETSPNIDRLAAESETVRFSRAFAPSTWTKPIAASILSGCYPPAHGVRTRSDLFLKAVPRLPELLQAAGYQTAAVSTIGNVSSSLGFAIGFDHFNDLYKDPSLVARREVSNTGAWKLYFEQDTTVVLPLAEDVNEHAFTWLDGATGQEKPWFLFLWALDPHDPYYPPSGFDRWSDPGYGGRIDGSAESVRQVRNQADVQRLLDLYDGEIAYTDTQFGLLLQRLRELEVFDDTLIVVAGDHGEAFGEHGDFVHGHLAYDEVMHVPLLIKMPRGKKRVPADVRKSCGALVQLTDIAPTILDVLGMAEEASEMQGKSLLPVLEGVSESDRAVYAETQSSIANNRLLAVRTERWKYLKVAPPAALDGEQHGSQTTGWQRRMQGYWQHLTNPEMVKKLVRNPMFYMRRQMADREMLFDLKADPGEQHNVIGGFPEVADGMRGLLADWLEQCHAYARISDQQAAGLGLDDETRRQLEGLGYLQ